MSGFNAYNPLVTGYLPDGRLVRAMARAAGSVSRWNRTRLTRAVLNKLSTHELDDIGLTRKDIDRIGRTRR